MKRLVLLATGTVVAVAAAALIGAEGGTEDRPPERRPVVTAAGVGLEAFDACDQLVDHLVASASAQGAESVAMRSGMWFGADDGAAGAAETAAPAADTSLAPTGTSDTNVQVAGVDEPDLVETDGRRLYTALGGVLHVVDVTTPVPALLATVPLASEEAGWGDLQLLLHDGRLLAVGQAWGPVGAARGGVAMDMVMGSSTTVLKLFDVTGDVPALIAEAEYEGSYVAGRGIDGTAHLVLTHQPQPVPLPMMEDVWNAPSAEDAGTRLLAHLDDTVASDWLPVATHVDARGVVTTAPAVDCATVYRTSEVTDTSMLEVLTFDVHGADLQPDGAAAVLTNAMTVTASADQLVVATPVWPEVFFEGPMPMPVDPGIGGDVVVDDVVESQVAPDEMPEFRSTTRLHLFDLTPQGAVYLSSGEVDGQLLNQFSMSLHEGRLRVATTVGEAWTGNSESVVTVLEPQGDRLAAIGSVGGLGRGEQIYAVRFLGDQAYVVTFRQVDPLYTIDLADPANPRVTGELKITGYSAYLHPLPGDRLLGVGQEATEEGRTVGMQVSLFDVSNPAAPARLAQIVLPNAYSEAEYDHHAFLYHDGVLVIPFERWGEPTAEMPQGYAVGAAVVDVGDATLGLHGTIDATGGPNEQDPWRHAIRRAVIANGTLFTVSPGGVTGTEVAGLTTTGTVAW
jgi:uncharacterized secreted protein with C-terminal beta-propeller domain